ncbi:MAG: hypothetical protein WCO33_00645 [bacterium]
MIQKITEPEKIFVELDDEITFVAEKVRNALSERVVLIIPDNAMLLSSLISIKILYKELLVTDKASVFIVKDEHGFSMIKKLNLEVVKNANEITENMWQSARMKIDEALREQSKKKSDLLEKRNLQKSEIEEKETQRVDEIIDQAEREVANEITHAKVQEEIKDKRETQSINYDLYKKTKRLPARVHKIGDRVFASGGDVSEFEEVKENIKLDVIGGVGAVALNNEESENEVGKGNLLNRNFNKHGNEFINNGKSGEDVATGNLLDRATKRQINSSNGNIFSKIGIFLKNISGFFASKIENMKFKKGKGWIIIPILLLFIVFIFLSITVFPSATIKLSENSAEFNATENISANVATTAPDLTTLTVPLEVLIVSVNGSQSLDTTTDKVVGTSKATGTVTFYNKTDTAISVPANTELTIKVSGTNYSYVTTTAVTVNKKTSSIGGETWGSKDATVVANSAGESFNIANQQTGTFSIAGFVSTSLTATMYPGSGFTGGASKKTKVVSQADVDKLKKDLTASLKVQAKTEATTKFADNYVIVTPDVDFQIDSDKLSAAVGQEATSVDYEIVAKATVKGVSKANIEALAKSYTEDRLSNLGNIDIKNSSSKYTLSKFEKEVATINLVMNTSYYISLDQSKIKNDLKSKTLSEATSILKTLEPATSIVNVDLFPQYLPDFLRKFPSNISKIDIFVEKK